MTEQRAEYVTTPHGRGQVVGVAKNGDTLVMFSHRDYTPEQWKAICGKYDYMSWYIKIIKPSKITERE
jgi:hypothetical protein